jgi:hypothetical protein
MFVPASCLALELVQVPGGKLNLHPFHLVFVYIDFRFLAKTENEKSFSSLELSKENQNHYFPTVLLLCDLYYFKDPPLLLGIKVIPMKSWSSRHGVARVALGNLD